MTWKPEDIVVSDDEVMAVFRAMNTTFPWEMVPVVRQALRAFLAARIPEPMPQRPLDRAATGFNDALDAVARGRG